ncbi:MAG: hypothetical protein ACREEL_08015 [Stellaceae bacterium]
MASFYRAEAVRLRAIAQRTQHSEIKVELLAIAARFEKLAQFSESRLDAAAVLKRR